VRARHPPWVEARADGDVRPITSLLFVSSIGIPIGIVMLKIVPRVATLQAN
jgi:hypothetical protein